MSDLLNIVSDDIKRPIAEPKLKEASEPLNIPHLLSSFDINITEEERQRFTEALDVNGIEASWRLKRPLPVNLLPSTPDPDIEWMNIKEQEHPRVIVTVTTHRCLTPHPSLANPSPYRVAEQDGYGGFVAERAFDLDDWCNPMADAVLAAVHEGAHLISFGEFDFPPDSVADHSTAAAQDYADRRQRFIRRLYAIIDRAQRPTVLFAGSCHQWQGTKCKNLGYILTSAPRGEAERTGPIIHEKQVSAKSLGENLKQVEKPSITTYKTKLGERTKIGRLGVLICIDAYDSTVTDAIFAQSSLSDEDRLGIVLVPSYNPNARLFWSCQALSYRANCFVVYVNALASEVWKPADLADRVKHDLTVDPWHRSAEIFAAGVPLETWRQQLCAVHGFGTANPRGLSHLKLLGMNAPADALTLGELAVGLSHKTFASGPFTLNKWTIPNGCFQKLLEFAESRQPESLQNVRSHVVTRRKR